ncbi:hypothetical protein V6N11_054416 [Hibiscus sabdariffa]|uniref:Uncharacterized protein n=1 Tax=Hibiscus sabdariffa TaxID=183260 RepID=A0ABR2S4A4_9ROSI
MEVGDFFIGGYYGGALTDLNGSEIYHPRHRPLYIHHLEIVAELFQLSKIATAEKDEDGGGDEVMNDGRRQIEW